MQVDDVYKHRNKQTSYEVDRFQKLFKSKTLLLVIQATNDNW